ncbi:MAG TPA: GMC family oxidoreductase [Caulobacteraceae bacterium]|nr:GMC family oxidoreductase [Caulobacteraceae bacterium]
MSGQMDADVIVVGAGILGGMAAERLARKGKAVLVLEAGPRVERYKLLQAFREAPNKNDYEAFFPEQSWAPKSDGGQYSDGYIENVGPLTWRPSMLKVVGGTTWHWSSAFWRYLPNDFKLKSLYGQGRDWPIGYDDLEPWYSLAEQITGCSGNDTDDQSGQGGQPFPPRSAPYPLPAEAWSAYTQTVAAKMNGLGFHFIDEPHLRATKTFEGRPACRGNNNCSPLCPIGAMFTGDMAVARAERAGAKVLAQTVAYKLETGPGGKIVAVHAMTPDGTSTRRTARYVILAAHAVETPKLMLMSGVGNRSGQVGRNLMSHPSLAWSVLARDPMWPGRGPVQQGGINDRRDGPDRARRAAIRYLSPQTSPNLGVTDRLLKQGVIGKELDDRIRHDAARSMTIIAALEMLPNPSNRITLGDRKDSLGLPNPRIHFDVDDYTRAGAVVVGQDFERFDQAFEVQTRLGDRKGWKLAAHVMGSTIMGADPRTSVVDGDCRSHDHANLFIASTGVFPSTSVVNPTLTGAALALRLAERIGQEI